MKTLRKPIIKCFELASRHHETQNTKDYNSYKQQINFCSNLCKKERRKFYNVLNIKDITDNKKFWKTLKPLLSDKGTCGSSKINLVLDEENLSDDKEIAIKKFKNHPSIAHVNKNIQKNKTFSFDEIETNSLKKMIDNLDSRKSGTFGGIPANCLKRCFKYLC